MHAGQYDVVLFSVIMGIAAPTMERYTWGVHSCIIAFVSIWPETDT
jgi:hypothetical protein